MLKSYSLANWPSDNSNINSNEALYNLESGNILYFPNLSFNVLSNETSLISTNYADPKTKNISYSLQQNKLWGVHQLTDLEHQTFKALLLRYAKGSS